MFFVINSPVLAQYTWVENGNRNGNGGDAGQTLATADVTLGPGALNDIVGVIGNQNDVDIYQIAITDPNNFSATTVVDGPPSPGTTPPTLNTQLFLFDANGYGIVANDDTASGEIRATIPPNFFVGVQGAGVYYLAISTNGSGSPGSGLNPVSMSGQIFILDPATALSGAIGPGFADPLSTWTGVGQSGGAIPYDIQLTGAGFAVPEPGLAIAGVAGIIPLLGYSLRRRRCCR
jgi:hypothetical protein